MRNPLLQFGLRNLLAFVACCAVVIESYVALARRQEKHRLTSLLVLVEGVARTGLMSSEFAAACLAETKLDGGRAAIQFLSPLLEDDQSAPLTFQVLAQFGSPAVPVLTEQLKSERQEARRLAALYLAYIGPEANSALPQLREMLRDEDSWVRLNVARAVWRIEQSPALAIPTIIKEFDSSDAEIRCQAVMLLGSIGPEAKAWAPFLTRALEDDDEYVRLYAKEALNQILRWE